MLFRGRYANMILRAPDGEGGGNATFPAEYVRSLREEAKEHRIKASEAEQRAATLQAEAAAAKTEAERAKAEKEAALETARAERETALAAAQVDAEARIAAATTEASTKAVTAANERIIRAELKAEAIKSGMVDPEGLKLLDTSGVTIDESGEVTIPADFFENAKKAKPWLFQAVRNTSNPGNPPPRNNNDPKPAKDWSAEERKAFERKNGIRS